MSVGALWKLVLGKDNFKKENHINLPINSLDVHIILSLFILNFNTKKKIKFFLYVI